LEKSKEETYIPPSTDMLIPPPSELPTSLSELGVPSSEPLQQESMPPSTFSSLLNPLSSFGCTFSISTPSTLIIKHPTEAQISISLDELRKSLKGILEEMCDKETQTEQILFPQEDSQFKKAESSPEKITSLQINFAALEDMGDMMMDDLEGTGL
jgi:hypothetical protein